MQWLPIESRMNLLSVPAPSLPVRRLGLNNIGLGFVAFSSSLHYGELRLRLPSSFAWRKTSDATLANN